MKKLKIIVATIMIAVMALIASACGFAMMPPPDGGGGWWDNINWNDILSNVNWSEVLTPELVREILGSLEIEDLFSREELIEFLGDDWIDEDRIMDIIRNMDISMDDIMGEDEFRQAVRNVFFEDIMNDDYYRGRMVEMIVRDILGNENLMTLLTGGVFNEFFNNQQMQNGFRDFVSLSIRQGHFDNDIIELLNRSNLMEQVSNLVTDMLEDFEDDILNLLEAVLDYMDRWLEFIMDLIDDLTINFDFDSLIRDFIENLDPEDFIELLEGLPLEQLITSELFRELMQDINLVEFLDGDALRVLVLGMLDDEDIMRAIKDSLLGDEDFMADIISDILSAMLDSDDFREAVEELIREIIGGGAVDLDAMRAQIRAELLAIDHIRLLYEAGLIDLDEMIDDILRAMGYLDDEDNGES